MGERQTPAPQHPATMPNRTLQQQQQHQQQLQRQLQSQSPIFNFAALEGQGLEGILGPGGAAQAGRPLTQAELGEAEAVALSRMPPAIELAGVRVRSTDR